MYFFDFVHFEIKRTGKSLRIFFFRTTEHEAQISSGEERQSRRRTKQVLQAKNVPIERNRPIQVGYRESNLPNLVQFDFGSVSFHIRQELTICSAAFIYPMA